MYSQSEMCFECRRCSMENFFCEKPWFDREKNEDHLVFNEQCALENQKKKFVISLK
jgi:hypothetical protein